MLRFMYKIDSKKVNLLNQNTHSYLKSATFFSNDTRKGIKVMEQMSILISIVAIIISIITFQVTFRFERKKATIEAYNDLQADLYTFYEYPEGEIETFVDESGTAEYKMLSTSLAQIEIFATGVYSGAYDKKLALQLSNGYLNKTLGSKINYLLELKLEHCGKEYYPYTRKNMNELDIF